MFSKTSQRRLTGVVGAAAIAAALASASPASAYTCSASALRGTVLTQGGIEPAAVGGSGCKTEAATLASLPTPLAGAANAFTVLSGPTKSPAQQQALSMAGVESLTVGSLRNLPLTLPAAQIPAGLDAVRVPLPANLGLLGLPDAITVNALPAAEALVPVRQLPDVALAAVRSLRSAVSAQCLAGLPNLIGASSVDGLTVLGEGLPTGEPVQRVVTLLDEQTIPLSNLSRDAVQLPGGLSFDNPVTGPALRTAVDQVLDGLPPIVMPPAVGTVETAPAEQHSEDGVLEQRALRMTVTAVGQQVADLVIGIARVATDGLSCAEAAVAPVIKPSEQLKAVARPVQPASQLAVSCSQADVTLVNVIDQGTHVTLIGAAAKKLVGKRVRIVQTWNGKRVATTKVGRSGFFRTKAPMPREALRYTNRARYMAVAGGEKSLPLKLHRRMRFSTLEAHGKKVTLKGRIFGPMSDERIEIRQAVSCTKDVVVKRIRPRSDGSWKVTLRAPKGARAVTYRATTMVRNEGSLKKFPTFTLPGYVTL